MGKVYLVGAGPGDRELITVKGLNILKAADAVLYDSLIDPLLLEETRPDCERIGVGKRMGLHSCTQEEIVDMLLKAASCHEIVVRLKGGDPFVFGRGGEEALALQAAGIPFEVVPGVTSAVAVPAQAGIPVTHREEARSFHVITGYTKDEALHYEQFAGLEGTLIFLMGRSNAGRITAELIAGGMDPEVPAAVIEKAFSPDQRTLRSSLGKIASLILEENVGSPAVIVVGKTAAYDLRSEAGCGSGTSRILVVGTKAFYERFRRQIPDAELLLEMKLRVSEPGKTQLIEALGRIEQYGWVSFSSQNAVRLFFGIANAIRFDRRRLASVGFAVIGQATADALLEQGYHADLMPETFTGPAMAAKLAERAGRERVLVIRAEEGNEEMFRILEEAGVPHERLVLYRAEGDCASGLGEIRPGDRIVLASASGVRALCESAGGALPEGVRYACIGGYTAKQLTKYGHQPEITATEHTAEGLARMLRGILPSEED